MKFVVATDGSPHAIRAASMAARFARELSECEVLLVTVGHISAFVIGGASADAMVDLDIIEQGLEDAGREALEHTKRQSSWGAGVGAKSAA